MNDAELSREQLLAEVTALRERLTVLERTKEQLRRAEARYRTLVEQIPAVTFMAALDHGLNEIYVSPQIETLLGFSQQEWLEDPILWHRQLHPDDRDRWHHEFARTVAFGEHFRSEYRFLARDGRIVWVHGECQVFRDEAGRPLFLQGVAFDITESKRAAEALQRMHEELEWLVQDRTAELGLANKALRAEMTVRRQLEDELRQRAEQLTEEGRRKDEFLAMLAHELRNPLAPIRNALHILKVADGSDAQAAQMRGIMERQVTHMIRLVDDLLDVSRVMRGKVQLRKERLDLASIVARAVETAQPLIDAHKHRLTVFLPAEPICLEADPVRLAQVLGNLLTNSAKYTEPGGWIAVSGQRIGSEVAVRVRDSGIGIAAEVLPHVFEPFTQGDRSLARSEGGLGIGLSLVRGLVELHGGRVTAASPGPGEGSEFVVYLPACEEASDHSERAPQRADGADGGPSRQRILVVEDNRDSAESLAALLRLSGHEVRVAHDGPSALAAAHPLRPDIVLLDIGLPGMSGYEVAHQLRREPVHGGMLLVALTGYGQAEDRRRSREAGFDYHLVKPVDPDALREVLTRLPRPGGRYQESGGGEGGLMVPDAKRDGAV